MTNKNVQYDLEERTAKFGEMVINFVKSLMINTVNRPLINQLVKSATSIGANYCEANGASSKKDFKNKIYICKKEALETKHWLRMIVKVNPETKDKAKELWQETQELTLIFSKILSTLRSRNSDI